MVSSSSLSDFNSGPRDCIGKMLAQNEGVVVLATLLRRYSFKLAPSYRFVYEQRFAGRPKYGLPLIVKRRELQ